MNKPGISTLVIFLIALAACKVEIKPVVKNQHWFDKVAKFEIEKAAIQDGCIIFLGNSITERFNLDLYFPEFHTVNRGIASDHIDGVIERLNLCLGGANAAKLVVLVGINDIGAGRSEESIKYLYTQLVKQIIKNYPYEVYLHSIMPTSKRWQNCSPELIVAINEHIKKLAKKYKLYFVDTYSLFLAKDSKYVNDSLMVDGLHPNENGYKIWANHLNEILGNNNLK